MMQLDDDASRKKILLRIENKTYDYCFKKAINENKSVTLVINELLEKAINA